MPHSAQCFSAHRFLHAAYAGGRCGVGGVGRGVGFRVGDGVDGVGGRGVGGGVGKRSTHCCLAPNVSTDADKQCSVFAQRLWHPISTGGIVGARVGAGVGGDVGCVAGCGGVGDAECAGA